MAYLKLGKLVDIVPNLISEKCVKMNSEYLITVTIRILKIFLQWDFDTIKNVFTLRTTAFTLASSGTVHLGWVIIFYNVKKMFRKEPTKTSPREGEMHKKDNVAMYAFLIHSLWINYTWYF